MLEKSLIEHCSATLSGLKCANLFNYFFTDEQQLHDELAYWNTNLAPKGIQLTVLRQKSNSALVYIYRTSKLSARLLQPETKQFLYEYGYTDMSVQAVISRLSARIQLTDSFPHEIGIMLDYPLCDVIGFITHKGENCKCVGTWKVYGDEHEAVKQFCKLKKCKSLYKNLYNKGKSVMRLTVAA